MWFYVDATAAAIDRLTAEIRRIAQWQRRPVFGFTLLLREEGSMLIYGVSALAPFANDVAERRLTVDVLGGESQVTVHGGGATSLGEIAVPRDATVMLSLVDVDTSGNESEPAVLEFLAKDTIAPGRPEGLSVTLVREE